MVCQYEDFLSLLTRRPEDINPPAGLINLGNRCTMRCNLAAHTHRYCTYNALPGEMRTATVDAPSGIF